MIVQLQTSRRFVSSSTQQTMIMIIFFPSPGQAADRGLQLRRPRPGRLLLGGHRGVAGVQSQHRAAAPLPGEDSTEDVTEEGEAAHILHICRASSTTTATRRCPGWRRLTRRTSCCRCRRTSPPTPSPGCLSGAASSASTSDTSSSRTPTMVSGAQLLRHLALDTYPALHCTGLI